MRTFILFTLAFILSIPASAQGKLMHSYGATISYLFSRSQIPVTGTSYSQKNNTDIVQTNVTYFPRYNFVEKDNSSVSVGVPLSAGVGIFSDAVSHDPGIGFSYDIPVVLDYNIGCKSTNANDRNFGGYVGAGFGYYSVIISGSKFSNFKGTSYGPMVRAGVRIGSPNWDDKAITVGMFYKKGLEAEKFSTIGFNVLIDL